jgi:hypothetical protein
MDVIQRNRSVGKMFQQLLVLIREGEVFQLVRTRLPIFVIFKTYQRIRFIYLFDV